MFNGKETEVAISSNPPGAQIIIDGRNYGETPAIVRIIPKNYMVTLIKEGHGTAKFNLEAWQAMRAKSGEGGRCLADAIGSVLILPAFSYWSIYCRDFKQQEYFIDIPYQGPIGGNRYNGPSQSMNPAYQQYYQQPSSQYSPQRPDPYRGY